MESFKFYVVRTAFHGGGIVSKHKTIERARQALSIARTGDCTCGCAGVVAVEDYHRISSNPDTCRPSDLLRTER